MRRIIADRLVASKRNVPHFYLQTEVDVTDTLAARKIFNDQAGAKVTINDNIVRCVALTLMEHPQMNAHVAPNSVIRKGDINVGFAVSVPDGLMAPVLAIGEGDGLAKVIFDDETGELLGAYLVGHEATELISSLSLGMALEATDESLADAMFAHPTVSEAIHDAVLSSLGRAIHGWAPHSARLRHIARTKRPR